MGGTAFDSRIHWESLTKILNCNTELPINLWFIGCVHTKVYSNGWDLFYMKVNEEWHPKSRNKIMGKIPHTTFNSWTNFSACKSNCQTVFQLITTVTGMQIKSVWFVVFIVSVWSAEVLELERSTVCWQRQLLQLVLMETKRECCKPAFHYQHKMWLRQHFQISFKDCCFGTFAKSDSQSETAGGEEKDVWWTADSGFKLKTMGCNTSEGSLSYICVSFCAISPLIDELQWFKGLSTGMNSRVTTLFTLQPWSYLHTFASTRTNLELPIVL